VQERQGLKGELGKSLTAAETEKLKTAYDRIGDIAIIEVGEGLAKKQRLIAETLLRLNPSIKSVYRKAAPHSGEFRVQKLTWLAGEKKKEAIYKENNISLKLDVTKVYFSPRLGNERKRVAEQVRPGEMVMVMFSGCGPYVCTIAKNTLAKEVWGIEINPVAHKYAVENAMLNKLTNVKLMKGDAKKLAPKIKEKFDRILMPLPKTGEDFLSTALKLAKKGTVVHFYDFQKEAEFGRAAEKVKAACKKEKLKCRILNIVRCGQYSPYVFRICVDFKVA
jgi:tRNA (guanine37-N1)-methyltransferase